MRRLMQTTIALPSRASRRCSKWATMSSAICLDPHLRADDRLELRPLGLELLPALDLLALGGFLELRVDVRPLALLQGQLGEAALVVDGHRGPVLDGTLDVVDADVVSEHGARVGVL